MTLTRGLAIVMGLSMSTVFAYAQDDFDGGVSIAQGGSDMKSKRRSYPGGRDEEDLRVQTSLPQPSRDPEVRTSNAPPPPADEAHD